VKISVKVFDGVRYVTLRHIRFHISRVICQDVMVFYLRILLSPLCDNIMSQTSPNDSGSPSILVYFFVPTTPLLDFRISRYLSQDRCVEGNCPDSDACLVFVVFASRSPVADVHIGGRSDRLPLLARLVRGIPVRAIHPEDPTAARQPGFVRRHALEVSLGLELDLLSLLVLQEVPHPAGTSQLRRPEWGFVGRWDGSNGCPEAVLRCLW